ncbi:MAG: RNA polymerase sigma factor [Phycisphaerales bacterium]|nr:RNA polymerase sigma factor [Phycisphaerales bacterium]
MSEYLVLDAQHGNRESLTGLVRLWSPRMTRRARRLTGDEEGAREVVQESWVAAARGLHSLRDPSKFGGWVYRIVQNKAADWIQQQSRDRVLNRSLRDQGVAESEDGSSEDYSQDIRVAIGHLDPKLREVVYLFYMDQCTVSQIAGVLGIPVGTVKTRLSAARLQLKSQLERSTQ